MKTKVKSCLIDVSADASNSEKVNTDGLLLSAIVCPATVTGSQLTFDFSIDGTNWYDVVETDGTAVVYNITAGDVVRIDPSGWAFASSGFLRITSNGTETADRTFKLVFRSS